MANILIVSILVLVISSIMAYVLLTKEREKHHVAALARGTYSGFHFTSQNAMQLYKVTGNPKHALEITLSNRSDKKDEVWRFEHKLSEGTWLVSLVRGLSISYDDLAHDGTKGNWLKID